MDRAERIKNILNDLLPLDQIPAAPTGQPALVVHGSLNIYMHAPGPAIVTASTAGAHGYVDRRRQILAGIPPAKPPAPRPKRR